MKKNSKELIVQASIILFNTKGFHATSIRDIATKANVNIANIAYYFKNKQGLLEYCLTNYFERYLHQIEEVLPLLEENPRGCLEQIARNILLFQSNNIQYTRFILREMSIDSQIVREIMSTYYLKEKFYLKKILEAVTNNKRLPSHKIPYLIIQFKGLLTMPYLNTHYVSEVLHAFPHEKFFVEKYLLEINSWIDGLLVSSMGNGKQEIMVPAISS